MTQCEHAWGLHESPKGDAIYLPAKTLEHINQWMIESSPEAQEIFWKLLADSWVGSICDLMNAAEALG